LGEADHDFFFRCQPRNTVQPEEHEVEENKPWSCQSYYFMHLRYVLLGGLGFSAKWFQGSLFLSFLQHLNQHRSNNECSLHDLLGKWCHAG
jgi:hypothetical protein